MVRRRWDEVVANIGSPVTRALVGPNAQVASLEGGLLRLGFAAPGMARTFSQPRHVDAVSESVYQTLGVQVRVEATLDEGRSGGGAPAPSAGDPDGPPPQDPSPGPWTDTPPAAPARPASPSAPGPAGGGDGGRPAVPPTGARSSAPGTTTPVATVSAAAAPAASPRASAAVADRPGGGVAVAERPSVRTAADDADAAWLAGASSAPAPVEEPPETSVGTPVEAPRAPAAPRADGPPPWAVEEPEAPAPASPPAAAPSTAPAGAPVRETPRQAAERRVREAQQSEGRPSWGPTSGGGAMDDEPSADDPDISSSGVFGVQLVVQVLDGKVVEEIADQP